MHIACIDYSMTKSKEPPPNWAEIEEKIAKIKEKEEKERKEKEDNDESPINKKSDNNNNLKQQLNMQETVIPVDKNPDPANLSDEASDEEIDVNKLLEQKKKEKEEKKKKETADEESEKNGPKKTTKPEVGRSSRIRPKRRISRSAKEKTEEKEEVKDADNNNNNQEENKVDENQEEETKEEEIVKKEVIDDPEILAYKKVRSVPIPPKYDQALVSPIFFGYTYSVYIFY